jgi:hypothetical protein
LSGFTYFISRFPPPKLPQRDIAGLLFFVPRARRTVLFEKTNRDVTVLLVASPAPEMLPGIDGIIGVNALHAHHIDFDFAGRTLSWN